MGERSYLGFMVLVWMGYGAYCFLVPESLAGAAGVVAQGATATTELRAMYGGLQFAIGELCLFALLRPGNARSALLAVAFLTSGLFSARLVGLIIDGSGSGYTYGGLGFEFVCAAGALALLARRGERVLA